MAIVEHFDILELLPEAIHKLEIVEVTPRLTERSAYLSIGLKTGTGRVFLSLISEGAFYWGPLLRSYATEAKIKCPENFVRSDEVVDLIEKLRAAEVKLTVRAVHKFTADNILFCDLKLLEKEPNDD